MPPRESRPAAALALLLVAGVAAFGGVYAWAAAVLAFGVAILAVWTRPRLARGGWDGALDRALIALLAVSAAHLIPLPTAILSLGGPGRLGYVQATSLRDDMPAFLPLSIDAGATLHAWVAVSVAVGTFWAARTILSRGGIRLIVTAIAWTAVVLALVAVAQETAGAGRVYGIWQPFDAGARPLGPFINRNHGATWALLALFLCFGYLQWRMAVAHAGTGGARAAPIVDLLDGRTVVLALAVVLLVFSIALSASRSAMLALACTSIAVGWAMPRATGVSRTRWRTAALALSAVLVVGVYGDVDRLVARVGETRQKGLAGRSAIWYDAARIVGDFPVAGTGAGTFSKAMRVYQTGDRTYFWNDGHNHYVQLLAEGGLLLAGPVSVAITALCVIGWRRLRAPIDPLKWMRLGAAGALAAAGLQSMWETGLTLPANSMLAAVAAAILVHENARTGERRTRPVPAPSAVLASLGRPVRPRATRARSGGTQGCAAAPAPPIDES